MEAAPFQRAVQEEVNKGTCFGMPFIVNISRIFSDKNFFGGSSFMLFSRGITVLAFFSSSLLAQGPDTDEFGPLQGKKPEREWAVSGRLRKDHARPPAHIQNDATAVYAFGLTPAKTLHAYGFDAVAGSLQGAGQTIAIIGAYDNPAIEADLGVFSARFALPACTTANGCFVKLYAAGVKPATDAGWALEAALDVEWVHAIAPRAKILLVEAASSRLGDLMSAVDRAVQRGASVVSMSWGASEFSMERYFDSHFNVRNVTFVAASGDSGTGAEYPASAENVVAVGGTKLNLTDALGAYGTETAWRGSGGGVSAFEPKPSFQAGFQSKTKRGVPDVAYDADPSTGFAVYDSVTIQNQSGWFQVGGTSAGAPQWAALFGIVNSMRAAAGKAPVSLTSYDLYKTAALDYAASFHDITAGSNGICGPNCTANPNYDFVTGLGSPQANHLIPALVAIP